MTPTPIIGVNILAGGWIPIVVVLLVRFPSTMPWRPREPLLAEITGGLRYSLGNRGFIAMLLYFMVLNVFLSPLFLMLSPLVLSFARLGDAGRIAFAAVGWEGVRHDIAGWLRPADQEPQRTAPKRSR